LDLARFLRCTGYDSYEVRDKSDPKVLHFIGTFAMSGQLYCTCFVGGPADGVVAVSSASCQTEEISLAIDDSQIDRTDGDGVCLAGSWRAVYQAVTKRHSVENDCVVIRSDYEFVGVELRPGSIEPPSRWRRMTSAIARAAAALRGCIKLFWLPLPEGRAPNDPGRRAAYRSARVGGCL
jgi:hypothetical protein